MVPPRTSVFARSSVFVKLTVVSSLTVVKAAAIRKRGTMRVFDPLIRPVDELGLLSGACPERC
jgi:hypothetical protein